MSPLARKLLRDLAGTAGPAATVAGILGLGLASLVGFLGMYVDLRDSRDRYYESQAFHHLQVRLRRAPRARLEELRDLPGVEALEARIQGVCPLEVPGLAERLSAQLVSLPEYGDPSVDRPRLTAGRWPRPGGDPEVLVSRELALARGLVPGSRIAVIAEEVRRELTVVGTAQSPEFIYIVPPGVGIVPQPESFGILWLRTGAAEPLFDMEAAANDLVVRVGAGTDPRALARHLEGRLEAYGVLAAEDREFQGSYALLRDELKQLLSHASFLPTVFLLASALVLNLVLGRLVHAQQVQIGTLRALGYSPLELALHYLGYGAVVTGAGILAGSAGGYWIEDLLAGVYAGFYHMPIEAPRVHPWLIALGATAGILSALVGVAGSLTMVLRMTPAEAMRPAGPELRAEGLVARLAGLPLLWRIALRNLLRHPFRTGVAALGVGLGTGMMISSRYMQEAMDEMAMFRFKVQERHDVEVQLADRVPARVVEELARLPGVVRAEAGLGMPFTVSSGAIERRVFVNGIDPGSNLARPRRADGTTIPIPGHGLLMCEKLAALLRVGPGDRVRMTSLKGRRETQLLPIESVFPSYLGMEVFAARDWLGRMVAEPEAVSYAHLAAPTAGGELEAALARAPTVIKTDRRRDKIQAFKDSVQGTLEVAAGVMAFFAGALAAGMVLNGALVSLAERRRELAVLRVQGFTRGEIGDILLYEQVLTALPGLGLGLLLGRRFAGMLYAVLDTELYRLPWLVTRGNQARALLLTIGFLVVSHLVLRSLVRHQDWQQDLGAKE